VEVSRKLLIDSHIRQLGFTVRDPVRHKALRELHAKKDYGGMVASIRSHMKLNMRLRVGLVNQGGPNAPAWVEKPEPLPAYGTAQFKQTLVTIYIRKAFIEMHSFEAVVCAMAHELSHVVLSATCHVLERSEEAVDLTAMMLGYRDFYRLASRSEVTDDYIIDHLYGYLSPEEVTYAANILSTM
jgi:hypothetical protein